MAWFEELNVDELEVPDEVKTTLKAAATDAKSNSEALTTLNNTVATLQTELTALKTPAVNVTETQKAVNLSLEGKRDMIMFRLSQDTGEMKDFKIYEPQIRKAIEQSPLELQANEQYVMNTYFMIRGMNLNKIVNDVKKGEGAYFTETPSNATPQTPVVPGTVESLTPIDIAYCEKNKLDKKAFATAKLRHQVA